MEPGRYRLGVSLACPWANRSLIVRRLLGLEDAISVAVADPIQDERSWRFTLDLATQWTAHHRSDAPVGRPPGPRQPLS